MKKTIFAALSVIITASCFCACSLTEIDDSRTTSRNTTTTTQTSVSKTETTTSLIDQSSIDTSIDDILIPESPNDPMSDVFGSFPSFDEATGFVASTREEIEEVYANSPDLSLATLSADSIFQDELSSGVNGNTIFSFDMKNKTGPDLEYYTYTIEFALPNDDNHYCIGMSSSFYTEYTKEEVDACCFINQKVTYFSSISKKREGDYWIVPLFGGNDEIGYWAMRPALGMAGFDTSNMSPVMP